MKSLEEINKYWHKINKCEIKKTATQPVFGDGNPKSKIIFIGEAPGKEEDLSGKPFVGRSGKFLSEMLSLIKLKREDVYITNTVKYRPPNNRDPKPEEIKECMDWLFEEINLINPELIVFLGRHSLNIFFPKEKISESHGKLLHKNLEGINTKKFLALYHPAAALYNGGMRETLIKDFKKIPKILEKL